MKVEQFVLLRQNEWNQLEKLLKRPINQLTSDEATELSQLYRLITSDLAIVQRDYPRHKVVHYLNNLVAQAHSYIYRTKPLAWERFRHFFTHQFPQACRQNIIFILIAAALFIIPTILAAVATAHDPEAAVWILPAEAQNLIPIIEEKSLWTDIPIEERPYTSSFIMTNNIRVTFLAFAGGMLAGILTGWVMLFNGLLLGGITGLTIHYGIGFDLWTFVIGHGVVELTVIILSGGAGLKIGWAILSPGAISRKDQLIDAAQQGVTIILGCIPLLIFAGLIEGFISPNELLPWPIKWGTGLVTGICLYTYLILSGREKEKNWLVS